MSPPLIYLEAFPFACQTFIFRAAYVFHRLYFNNFFSDQIRFPLLISVFSFSSSAKYTVHNKLTFKQGSQEKIIVVSVNVNDINTCLHKLQGIINLRAAIFFQEAPVITLNCTFISLATCKNVSRVS